MVPLPWYSSDMIRSRSSLLRSMPIYQAQLKRTAFRSFSPAAGVKTGRAGPRPCAPAAGSALIVRTAPIAIRAPIVLYREAMMFCSCRLFGGRLFGGRLFGDCLLGGVLGGDLDHASVRHSHRPEKS